jgi:hypothetical protein
LWAYTFSARASVDTGAFCYVGQASDQRSFYVAAPTCVTGTVKWQIRQPGGGTLEGPWAGAVISFYVSESHPKFAGQLLGTAVSDDSGNFCIDRMPVNIAIDVVIHPQPGPDEAAGLSCSGGKENLLPAHAMKTCAEGGCNDAGNLIAPCYVD